MSQQKPLLVISGGARGIGKAIARAFAAEGFQIATFSRNEKEIAAMAHEIQTSFDVPVYFEAFSVSNKSRIYAFAKAVLEKCGTPAVLVNNAGFFVPGQIHNEEDGVLEATMETNLNGSYHLTRAFLEPMIASKSGHIFNICSTASITAYTNGGSYCISKFAMLGFSRVLREELKPHKIRVTSILPGATYTSSWEGAGLPEERFMQPEDIAETIFSAWGLKGNAVVEEILMRPMEGDI